MILWGFLILLAGALTALGLFLTNLDLFGRIAEHGFGGYVAEFFAVENLQAGKIAFLISVAAAILGLVLYLVGRAKNKDEHNPVIPVKVTKFFRDVRGEFKKIVWPGFPAVVRNTGVVLAVCAVVAVVIVLVDFGLGQLVDLFMKL